MEKNQLYTLISRSARLEGATLDMAQTKRLLEEGVSSEGKTIAEQLMILDLAKAYENVEKMASAHEFLSIFKLRSIAAIALKNSGFDGSIGIREEMALQKMCSEVNEARLHVRTTPKEQLYKIAWLVHFRISAIKPWPVLNDVMARLMMNEVQMDFGLEPTFVADEKEYRKTLAAAIREDIADIFVNHAAEAMGSDHAVPVTHTTPTATKAPAEKPAAPVAKEPAAKAASPVAKDSAAKAAPATGIVPPVAKSPAVKTVSPAAKAPKAAPAADGKPKTRDIILELLSKHPTFTTADLAGSIGISTKGIEKHLARLKAEGVLKRIGPDKGGHWQVG